jgi:hypothetical protein
MSGMLFGMDTGIIGGVIVLPAFTKYVQLGGPCNDTSKDKAAG